MLKTSGNKSFAVFAVLLLISLWIAKPSRAVTVDRVLATIGDEIITMAEYNQFIKESGRQSKDEVDPALLKKLIEERIIIQEAKRKGLEVTDGEVTRMTEEFKSRNSLSQEELENLLKEEGLTIKSHGLILKDKALISRIISGEVDSKVIVRDKEVEDYYKTNKKEFLVSAEKVEVKAIFLRMREDASVTELTDLKRRALRIVALLKDGYNFDSLVDEYSDEPLRSQGGMLGIFVKGGLIPPLDRKAFSGKDIGISDPIWVNEGVYILNILSRSGETVKTFDEVKEEIRDNLYRQERDKIYNEWIKELWERALVTINQS